MDGSHTTVERIPTGASGIDHYWGGVFRGGRYLVYGRNAAGRNLLPMVFLASATNSLETSLLVTRLREADLDIQAFGIGFDAQSAKASGLLKVSRIPAELDVLQADDEGLESALKALASLIVDADADRVVIDDFSPFSRFSSFDHFRTAFVRLLDEVERVKSTMVIGMPEPANDASRRIIDMIGGHMTGSVHVHIAHHEGFSQRTLSLLPQIGHATRRVDVPWEIDMDASARTTPSVVAIPSLPLDESDDDGQLDASDAAVEPHMAASPEPPPTATPRQDDDTPIPEAPMVSPELTVVDEFPGQVFDDRDAFADELQLYFEDYESSGAPFVLVAMRMEDANDGSESDDFQVVTGLVRESLYREDTMLADPGTEKIVVILGQEDGAAAQELFARIKDRMRSDLPRHADELMNAVSAVVVNNGSPFLTASEFLSYVLDSE